MIINWHFLPFFFYLLRLPTDRGRLSLSSHIHLWSGRGQLYLSWVIFVNFCSSIEILLFFCKHPSVEKKQKNVQIVHTHNLPNQAQGKKNGFAACFFPHHLQIQARTSLFKAAASSLSSSVPIFFFTQPTRTPAS